MIINQIDANYYEVRVTIKEIIYGSTFIDKINGNSEFENTTIKLRCTDCTIMVFKEDFKHFRDKSNGYTFNAIVKKWKENTYNFKKLLDTHNQQMKQFKILEMYGSEMNETGQEIVIIELAEVELQSLLDGKYEDYRYSEIKKFIIAKDSSIFKSVLDKANNDEYVSFRLEEFRIREELKNGRVEELAFHKTVFLSGIDKLEDFNW